MSITKIRSLQEERKKVWDRCQAIMKAAEDENRDLAAEERTNWDDAEARVAELSSDIERYERMAKLESVDFDQLIEQRAEKAEETDETRSADRVQRAKTYETAFSTLMRRGLDGLNPEQRVMMQENFAPATETRAQGTTTTAGGYLIPPGFLLRITETMKAFGGILNVAEVIMTETGNPLQWPSFDGTAQAGQILSENTQETPLDMAFGTKTLGAFAYSSRIIQVSIQLMQDTAFDLDAFVARQIGIRIGRAVAPHLANGTGTGQPAGLFNGATIGKTGLTGQTTSVIYDDLVDLIHSVDPAYRQADDCRWVMSDSSLRAIRKLKDSQGHPLWEPSVQAGVPSVLLGYQYTVDQGVANMAANATPIGFGAIREAFIVRQVAGGQLLRLSERYADYLQIGYLGFLRLDAKPNDTAAFRVYANSPT
jgi:HK97 family phage major capsid protein